MINFEQFKVDNEDIYEFAQKIDKCDEIELLNSFNSYNIDQNIIKFNSIIQMISQFIKYRQKSLRTITKFILNITDALKNTFSEDQIIEIFKVSSQPFLDFLYEQKIISRPIIASNYTEDQIYTSFYIQSLEQKIDEDENEEKKDENNNDCSYSIRKIIQNDDIDSFQNFISQTNENINSNLIKNSNQKSKQYFNSFEKQCQKYIEYAALYGSIQIFKYLWMNNAAVTDNLFPVSIYGGNFEIIHLVESKINNDVNYSQNIDLIMNKAVTAAVSCFRHELVSYLCDNYSITFEYNALYHSLISNNLPDLLFMIEYNFDVLNTFSYELNETIFHNPNHFTQYSIIKYILLNYLELKKSKSIENEIQMGLKDKIVFMINFFFMVFHHLFIYLLHSTS